MNITFFENILQMPFYKKRKKQRKELYSFLKI